MTRDYYRILGVDPDATSEEVRSAYRREAQRVHPDHTGEDSQPFLDINEAYQVLSDPHRRCAYDEARRVACRRSGDHSTTERRRCPVEPLIPAEGPGGRWSGPAYRSRSHRPFELHVAVSLTAAQARRGGALRIWVPAQVVCPFCHGEEAWGPFTCSYCGGHGVLQDELPVELAYTGGVRDGDVGRVSLGRQGGRDASLTLHFRVDAW